MSVEVPTCRRDIEHEARLAHRRAGGDEYEIGGLQSRRHLVEIDEAGRHAGDQPLVLLQLLDCREAALHEVAQRDKAGANAILGNGKDRPLGLVEQKIRLLFRLVRLGEDLVRRMNEIAESGLLLDDPRVVLDVGRTRHAVGQRRKVGRTAYFVELTTSRQLFPQRDEVDRIVALAERNHAVEDPAVGVAEKIARVDELGGVIERFVVNQDRAEYGFLGVEAVR